MYNVVDNIGWIGVSGWVGGLKTPSLVYRHIDKNSARFQKPQHLGGDEFWRGGAGYEHCTNDEVCLARKFLDTLRCRVNGAQLSTVLLVQLCEFSEGAVNDRDICAHTQCDAERAAADNTAAEHQNLGRCNTRHTAQ